MQKAMTNNRIFVYLLIIFNNKCNNVSSVVYLRERNNRGPDAWRSGVDCLLNISNLYLYDPLPSRAKNCAILHTSNMSAPANDIEAIFLKSLNDLLLVDDLFKGYVECIIIENE